MAKANKKHKKMDPKLVAAKQNHELDDIREIYGVGRKKIREAVAAVGHSREKVIEYLLNNGDAGNP